MFFDLVFVFAIGQLSHQLLAHPTWTGAAQTLVLYLAVYAEWAYTTWAVTLVPAEDPRTRRMLLAVMFVGLFMNAAIPRAFDDAGWVFAATFLLIHLGRTVWLLRVGLDRVNQEHFVRILVWFAAAAPWWLVGAAAGGGARLAWWAAAIVVELVGAWMAQPLPGRRLDSRQVTFAGGHLLERGRLFMIIAFGETILTTAAGGDQERAELAGDFAAPGVLRDGAGDEVGGVKGFGGVAVFAGGVVQVTYGTGDQELGGHLEQVVAQVLRDREPRPLLAQRRQPVAIRVRGGQFDGA
ncbi:low temperature requirement protein A [Amycolatopsis sp. cmx-4-68]|uniref:low temperature requirement protein A n=1 Tax=Amycolatopsis sp. cmx-4-68 TaxID=2790938 RepID=UPI00397B72BC